MDGEIKRTAPEDAKIRVSDHSSGAALIMTVVIAQE